MSMTNEERAEIIQYCLSMDDSGYTDYQKLDDDTLKKMAEIHKTNNFLKTGEIK